MAEATDVWFTVDMAGINPAGSSVPDREGPYQVTLSSWSMNDEKNKNGQSRLNFVFEVAAPHSLGCVIYEGMNVPDGPDVEQNKAAIAFWKTFLMSFGVPKESLDKKVKIGPKALEGKKGYCYYTPKNKELGRQYDDKKWLTEAQYKTKLSTTGVAAAAAAADRGTNGTSTTAPATTTAAAKTEPAKPTTKTAEPAPTKAKEVSIGDDGGDPLDFIAEV